MFRWYENAEMCYAYLSDARLEARKVKKFLPAGSLGGSLSTSGRNSLEHSRWFRRGWTLQDLLAPREFIFFDKCWREFGTRHDLSEITQAVTSIDARLLRRDPEIGEPAPRSERIANLSVATRMSWAAKRETTREEDLAYCLLGIFGINMPMLYGERSRAFKRLQEEIMKMSGDASLLAWDYSGTWIPLHHSGPDRDGLLASHPRLYERCAELRPHFSTDLRWENSFSMSQHGLEFEGPVVRDPMHRSLCYAILACVFFDEIRRPGGPFRYTTDSTTSYVRRANGGRDTRENCMLPRTVVSTNDSF